MIKNNLISPYLAAHLITQISQIGWDNHSWPLKHPVTESIDKDNQSS